MISVPLQFFLFSNSNWTCLQPLSPYRVDGCFGIELRTCLRPEIVSFYWFSNKRDRTRGGCWVWSGVEGQSGAFAKLRQYKDAI